MQLQLIRQILYPRTKVTVKAAENAHLRLQEAPQGPLLLDALAADRDGHAERQNDDDK